MGRQTSNFSELAYKRSKAADKEAQYKERAEKYGVNGGGLDYSTLSAPVLSDTIDGNKVVIRQWGYSQENRPRVSSAGRGSMYQTHSETDDKGHSHEDYGPSPQYSAGKQDDKVRIKYRPDVIGIQTIMNRDPETGTLSPSDEIPVLIRLRKNKSTPEGIRNEEDLGQAWCNMVKNITKDVPAIDTMPFKIDTAGGSDTDINGNMLDDDYINQDANATIEEDIAEAKPKDTGSLDFKPHFKVKNKKKGGSQQFTVRFKNKDLDPEPEAVEITKVTDTPDKKEIVKEEKPVKHEGAVLNKELSEKFGKMLFGDHPLLSDENVKDIETEHTKIDDSDGDIDGDGTFDFFSLSDEEADAYLENLKKALDTKDTMDSILGSISRRF